MDNDNEESLRSVELSESDVNEDNQKPSDSESNANNSEENVNLNKGQNEPKSLGVKSISTASIQREGRYVTLPRDKSANKKDGVVSKTTETIQRPFKIICDLCDPIRHWYGQIFIALGIILTAILVIILLYFGGYWD